MAGTPDLFVVCKNCRAEVSPYITECPYCGHRLRKRAPKLDKGAVPRREKPRRRPPTPSMPRVSAGTGRTGRLSATGRPVVTMALVAIPALLTVVFLAGAFDSAVELIMFGEVGDDWWRPLTTTLLYPAVNFGGTAYELVTLGVTFLFGWLLERRHGHWAPLLVWLVGTAVGMALVVVASDYAMGGNAGALALLCAWSVRDLLARRRGEDVDADLLGVAAFAVVMLLLPAAVREANPLAGAGGALAGLLLGLVLARVRER
jgi:membrane associated rhomboid family serine protease/DNA-directed RNA polymerase subunit RPC12/RpoP